MLGDTDDRGTASGLHLAKRRQLGVLGLLLGRIDWPAVRAARWIAKPLRDPLDHVVGKSLAELVRMLVRLCGAVAHEIGQQALDQPVLADDALGSLAPGPVSIASLCSPRSISPSDSSRFSISRPTRA